jgi:hypothetical protein
MLEWIAALLIIAALGVLGFWLIRGYLAGGTVGGGLFGGGREQRIGVIETASIDGRRKLMLIYRDGVEHLVMTGGPIDVVIEQGIMPQRRPQAMDRPTLQPHDPGEPIAHGGQQQGFGARIRNRFMQPTLDSQ